MPHLSRPTTSVHESYVAAVAEYQTEGGYPDFDDLDIGTPEKFARYVDALRHDPVRRTDEFSRRLPAMTLLWWIDGPDYLGRLSIWHALTGDLAESGHIGYDIRPSMRRHGHASAMLAAALPVACALGIDPALMSVRVTNAASRRIIEANGGQLGDERCGRLYYQIPTGS